VTGILKKLANASSASTTAAAECEEGDRCAEDDAMCGFLYRTLSVTTTVMLRHSSMCKPKQLALRAVFLCPSFPVGNKFVRMMTARFLCFHPPGEPQRVRTEWMDGTDGEKLEGWVVHHGVYHF
jgi:hypothetical protein